MELVFELSERDVKVYDKRLITNFLNALVRSLQTEILNELIPAKFDMLEQGLLNATWIRWKKKPSAINIPKLVKNIVKCIKWQERKNSFRVYIDPTVRVPHTVNTTYEQIARFLDKGNNVSKHSTMFSRVFNRYQLNIDAYWKAYVEVGYIVDTIESEVK